jgi:uncharacterized protein (TIGR00369 family)
VCDGNNQTPVSKEHEQSYEKEYDFCACYFVILKRRHYFFVLSLFIFLMSLSFRLKNLDFENTVRNHALAQGYLQHIGCMLTIIEPGYVEAEMPIDHRHHQQLGFTHGGITAAIADTVAGFAGFTLVGADEHTVTAEIKVSYFAPGIGSRLRAVGRVVKPTRHFHFTEAEVFVVQDDGTEKLIAKATATMAIIQPHEPH